MSHVHNNTFSLSLLKTRQHQHHHHHPTTSLKIPTTTPEMDPEIWSRIPAEILEHVLSFLPLKTLLTLRSTCKHFKSLIFSTSFISKWSCASNSHNFSSFLLLSHPQCYNNFPLYDSLLGNWRSFALSLSFSQSSTLLSSSKGLFCFSVHNGSCLFVCNFLSKSNRVVEFPSSYNYVGFESLTLVSTSFGYRIFILCSKFSSNLAFLYDSMSLSWKSCDGYESVLRSNNSHQEGVFFNNSLYFTTTDPLSVVYFDLGICKWKRLSNEVPNDLTFVRLVSDEENRLFLIGGIGRNGISKSIKLWELINNNGENWIEIESLPEMMCRKFVCVCYHNYEHVYCFWHQGMICVCCYTWPEILYYKVERKTWHWLPKCPSVPEKWSCGFKWFPFVPQLSSLA